jgi:hypothetical protein
VTEDIGDAGGFPPDVSESGPLGGGGRVVFLWGWFGGAGLVGFVRERVVLKDILDGVEFLLVCFVF